MICEKCQGESLVDCTCPDLDERLEAIKDHIVFPKCAACGRHWERCKCSEQEVH